MRNAMNKNKIQLVATYMQLYKLVKEKWLMGTRGGTIFVPFLGHNHYVFAAIGVSSNVAVLPLALLYDPLEDSQLLTCAAELSKVFQSMIYIIRRHNLDFRNTDADEARLRLWVEGTVVKMPWALVPRTVPSQQNDSDCGPYAITGAAFVSYAGEEAFRVANIKNLKGLAVDKGRTSSVLVMPNALNTVDSYFPLYGFDGLLTYSNKACDRKGMSKLFTTVVDIVD